MSALLQQLPTLVGVVIGALGSYLISAVAERSRSHREHRAWWDDRRAAAYADYASAVKTLFQITLQINTRRNIDPSTSPDELAHLQAADTARAAKWETMMLVGTARTVEAARQWHRTIWALVELVSADSYDVLAFARAVEKSGPARSNFYESARRDLGLSGESLPAVDYSSISTWIVRQRSGSEPADPVPPLVRES